MWPDLDADRDSDVEWRTVAVNLFLVFLSVMLVFTGFEAALRVGLVEDSSPDNDFEVRTCHGPNQSIQFHPVYGWLNSPNRQYIANTGDWDLYTINDEGFRDTYNSGEGNIIVLGDSFTEGKLVGDNETYAHLLDRWTPETAVRNRGVGAYGTAQELLVYRNLSNRYDHRAVVLYYYLGNDAQDNVNNHPRRPRFALQSGELVQVHEPRNVTNPETGGGRGVVGGDFVQTVQDLLSRHTETYSYLAPRLRTLLRRTGLINQAPTPPDGAQLRRQLRLTGALVSEMGRETRRHNATLFVVMIPERGDLNPDNPHHYRAADGQPYWDAQRRLLRNVSRNHSNVHVLGLEPHLRAAREEGENVYAARDGHLVERGHRVTARVTYRRLAEQGTIDGRRDVNFSREYGRTQSSCP